MYAVQGIRITPPSALSGASSQTGEDQQGSGKKNCDNGDNTTDSTRL